MYYNSYYDDIEYDTIVNLAMGVIIVMLIFHTIFFTGAGLNNQLENNKKRLSFG